MATAPTYLSLEEFEHQYTSAKPYYEYWFGEAIQKSMPTVLHGVFQAVLCLLLRQRGFRVATEVRLKLSAVAQPIPDVIADRRRLDQPYPKAPFDLCIEILSPRDDLHKTFQKAAHYLDWGIRYAWIIDPDTRTAFVMSVDHPQPVELTATGSLSAGPELTPISLSELFEEVQKMLS